jgi:hypothetical protein
MKYFLTLTTLIILLTPNSSFADDNICYIETNYSVFDRSGNISQKEKFFTKQFITKNKEECVNKAKEKAKYLPMNMDGTVTLLGFVTNQSVEVYPFISWKYGQKKYLGLYFSGDKGYINNKGSELYKSGDCRFFKDGAKWDLNTKCEQKKIKVVKKEKVIYKDRVITKKVYLSRKEEKIKPFQFGDPLSTKKMNELVAQINLLQKKNKDLEKKINKLLK